MQPAKPPHFLTLSIWLSYIFFVVYGSLVPLDFKPYPLEQAWAIFQNMPTNKLSVESRADWIANIVLGIPTGFLTAHLFITELSKFPRGLLLLFAGLFSFIFVTSVEFAQFFFPPRSSSLDDVLAQSIGSVIGLSLAGRFSGWFNTLLNAVSTNPKLLTLRLAEAYLASYVAFSLFPYDILFSGFELEQKLRGNQWGWLLAGNMQDWIVIALKIPTEIIAALPFGLFLGYRSSLRTTGFRHAALIGALLGGCIEVAQFFTASGISEGLSVITRIVGVCGGLALWQRRANWSPERLAALTQRYALPLDIAYLVFLLQVNGWLSYRWTSVDFATSRIGDLHFLPFYYHYFTSEAKALLSLASVCLMYAPIGLLVWSRRGSPSRAFLLALAVASLIEAGKLFLQGLHPDPTNAIIGALAAWGTVRLANELAETTIAPAIIDPAKIRSTDQTELHLSTERAKNSRWKSYVVLLPSLTFAGYWAASFPTQPVLLCLFLAACAAIVWHRPVLLLAILLAALPILDLAPWSGRFYLDEYDLLLLSTLAIGYARTLPTQHIKPGKDILFSLASLLIAISLAISALRGLAPWQTPNANAFTNYYSSFNALRIGKGALWAFLVCGLLRRFAAAKIDTKRPLAYGMVIGLTLTVIVILWERLTFTGLFNFTHDYRVTGSFSAMHIGGAYIECFLAVATPFLILLILQTRSWVGRMLGVTLLLATTYALMVTFSRNGYSAFGVAVAIILFFTLFKSGRWQQRGVIVSALSMAILVVAYPVFTGKFAQDRLATIGNDLTTRQKHWEDALSIRSPDWATTLFGMGLGRFPESHYLLSAEGNRSGTYQLMSENRNTFLRLVSGSSIYIGQRVSVKPQQQYRIVMDARTNTPDSTITLPICEKWLISSFGCIWSTFEFKKETNKWHHFDVQFRADQINHSHWFSQRPVKLALYNGNQKAIVDIDNVRLETAEGNNLLLNGDFSNTMDHWFFTADSHLQWHIKSLPVAVLFDQGWFGLMVLCLFSALSIKRAAIRAWFGEWHAAAVLASFCAFLVVSLFDTLIDAPRFLFLFLVLGWYSGVRVFPDKKGD